MSKKTKVQLEQEIQSLKGQLQNHYHSVDGSSFSMETKIVWDKSSVQAIDKVAQGLLNLTELFSKQKIELPSMLSLNGTNGSFINGCVFDGNQEGSAIESK